MSVIYGKIELSCLKELMNNIMGVEKYNSHSVAKGFEAVIKLGQNGESEIDSDALERVEKREEEITAIKNELDRLREGAEENSTLIRVLEQLLQNKYGVDDINNRVSH
ncbi:MAG TPA: hypothetical protein PKD95_04595 [Candidatus Paceibacterota bacterium]|nr:hypothetical protein [Candidatus Paceibacterota bacterium]